MRYHHRPCLVSADCRLCGRGLTPLSSPSWVPVCWNSNTVMFVMDDSGECEDDRCIFMVHCRCWESDQLPSWWDIGDIPSKAWLKRCISIHSTFRDNTYLYHLIISFHSHIGVYWAGTYLVVHSYCISIEICGSEWDQRSVRWLLTCLG
jgi:hypothetical protein